MGQIIDLRRFPTLGDGEDMSSDNGDFYDTSGDPGGGYGDSYAGDFVGPVDTSSDGYAQDYQAALDAGYSSEEASQIADIYAESYQDPLYQEAIAEGYSSEEALQIVQMYAESSYFDQAAIQAGADPLVDPNFNQSDQPSGPGRQAPKTGAPGAGGMGPGSGGGGGGGKATGGSTTQTPAATAAQIAAEFLKLQRQGVDVARVAANTSQQTAANIATTKRLLQQTAHPTANWFSQSTITATMPNGAVVALGIGAVVAVLLLTTSTPGKG